MVTYTSDRFGFRNADQAWDRPSVSIALLGDSFMQGACVADRHTVAARLAASGRSVIGLGTAGNNGLMHAAVARAFLPAMRPQHAVLVFYANEHLDSFAPRYRLMRVPGQDLELQIIDRDMACDVRGARSTSRATSWPTATCRGGRWA